MIIYFLPIPIITSIIGASLTLTFHVNYAENQTLNSLYQMEHSYNSHEFIFYKNKSFNEIVSKYNNLNFDQKKQFIINSLKLSNYTEQQKINIPYFTNITYDSISEYVSLIRNNQSLNYWNNFKKDKISNYLYFKWTAFGTANYLEKITTLNFVKASNNGFIAGVVVLSISILSIAFIMTYYYFSKKNGYEKDMKELGYNVGYNTDNEKKLEFKNENKINLQNKSEIIDILSKNKEIIDYQKNNSHVGFKNKILQPKNNNPTVRISKTTSGIMNNPTVRIPNPTSRINNNTLTSKINSNKLVSKKEIHYKNDIENTKKINLYFKKVSKTNSMSFFKKNKQIKKIDKILRDK